MLDQKDILCLRHACSEFNVGENEFYYDNAYSEDLDRRFNDEVLYAPKFIDAQLSKQGIKQCQQVRTNPTLSSVQIVLVSPLYRALQTAEIVFGKLNIPIIVIPELTESFRFGCDEYKPSFVGEG